MNQSGEESAALRVKNAGTELNVAIHEAHLLGLRCIVSVETHPEHQCLHARPRLFIDVVKSVG